MVAELEELDDRSGQVAGALRVRQASTLALAASRRELGELVETGLLPEQALAFGTAQADRRQ